MINIKNIFTKFFNIAKRITPVDVDVHISDLKKHVKETHILLKKDYSKLISSNEQQINDLNIMLKDIEDTGFIKTYNYHEYSQKIVDLQYMIDNYKILDNISNNVDYILEKFKDYLVVFHYNRISKDGVGYHNYKKYASDWLPEYFVPEEVVEKFKNIPKKLLKYEAYDDNSQDNLRNTINRKQNITFVDNIGDIKYHAFFKPFCYNNVLFYALIAETKTINGIIQTDK